MSFEATVYLHGAGIYAADPDGTRLLILLPEPGGAPEDELPAGHSICDHKFTVEYAGSGANGGGAAPVRKEIEKEWVGIGSRPSPSGRFLSSRGRIPGVPSLAELLDLPEDPQLDPALSTVVPEGGDSVRGGLFFDQGVFSPHTDFEAFYRLDQVSGDGDRGPSRNYSSVFKIELGEVEELVLLRRAFGPDMPIERIELRPPEGIAVFEIWMRYHCSQNLPTVGIGNPEEESRVDNDFLLNYAFVEGLEDLRARRNTGLLVPHLASSWAEGDPCGMTPRQCMGACVYSAEFHSPFE